MHRVAPNSCRQEIKRSFLFTGGEGFSCSLSGGAQSRGGSCSQSCGLHTWEDELRSPGSCMRGGTMQRSSCSVSVLLLTFAFQPSRSAPVCNSHNIAWFSFYLSLSHGLMTQRAKPAALFKSSSRNVSCSELSPEAVHKSLLLFRHHLLSLPVDPGLFGLNSLDPFPMFAS